MPSGHAGGAMSAAAFVFYRYGWESALPLIALSVVTSASRVYAQKHSIWQVLVGSGIAWGFAALFTTPYHPSKPYLFVRDNRPKRQFFVFPIVGRDRFYSVYYGLNVSYVFQQTGNLSWGNHLNYFYLKHRFNGLQSYFRGFQVKIIQSTTAITSIVIRCTNGLQIKRKTQNLHQILRIPYFCHSE